MQLFQSILVMQTAKNRFSDHLRSSAGLISAVMRIRIPPRVAKFCSCLIECTGDCPTSYSSSAGGRFLLVPCVPLASTEIAESFAVTVSDSDHLDFSWTGTS